MLHVFEAGGRGQVEDEEDSNGALIVGAGDGLEGLLAGCVPDL